MGWFIDRSSHSSHLKVLLPETLWTKPKLCDIHDRSDECEGWETNLLDAYEHRLQDIRRLCLLTVCVIVRLYRGETEPCGKERCQFFAARSSHAKTGLQRSGR